MLFCRFHFYRLWKLQIYSYESSFFLFFSFLNHATAFISSLISFFKISLFLQFMHISFSKLSTKEPLQYKHFFFTLLTRSFSFSSINSFKLFFGKKVSAFLSQTSIHKLHFEHSEGF